MPAATPPVPPDPPGLRRLIMATSIGNALEWYDIAVYGYFALQIARAFFPTADRTLGLVLALGTFAISYLARPLGAVLLGSYADRAGRRPAMLLCIALMTLGTAMITVMPRYASIGILAPVGILCARLVQGLSAGGEFGSATAFLVEAAPHRRGYIASWQFASQGLSSLVASLFGAVLSAWMPPAALADWGWRIPFAFGLLVGPVGLYIRGALEEPDRPSSPAAQGILATVLGQQKLRLVVATGCLVVSTAVNYLLVYMPTYAVRELKLPQWVGFVATLAGAVLLFAVPPFVGHVSDRTGRTRLMLAAGVLLLLSFYPAFLLLTTSPGVASLVGTVMWLALLKAVYFGALGAVMAELFPTETRATGLSLSYNVGVTLFGGLAPLVMVWLTEATGSKVAPSFYLIATAVLSIVALLSARRRFGIA